ncbi:MAG: glycosyl transferase [Paraburkholderia sp.]|uniref:ArnT family glycosyltransferase n=1 Tax=Paraburkholderia sp. TaxID=1926495 RepID=UPI00121B618E|nr:glycosyl transferase [Paraburkholderia sp.]TAL94351.1 MAG: glycosyl transferase [Paraburkholderia sp.]
MPIPPHETNSKYQPARRAQAFRRVALGLAWLLLYLVPGIVGREPWKQDETYTFGIIQHMASSGDWVVPMNAGVPFMEKPPLFYWLASVFMRASAGWLPAPDGARLATLLAMLIAFAAVAATARLIAGNPGWLTRDVTGTVLLLAGTIGLVKHSHDLFTDIGLMAASASALYALIRIVDDTAQSSSPRWLDAILFGISIAATFMTKGLLMPGVFGIASLLVPVFVPSCRSRRYVLLLGTAVAAGLPLMTIWPWLLAQRSSPLFIAWFWDNNVGRFLGFSVPELGSDNTLLTPVKAMLFFAFPIGPLALLAMCRATVWRDPRLVVAALVVTVGLVTLGLSATMRELYLLPLLPALAPLAASFLRRLTRLVQRAWVAVSSAVAIASLCLGWAGWWIMRAPVAEHHWLSPLARWLPLTYQLPARQPVALAAAVALTLGWLLAQPVISRSGRWSGAWSWTAAMTLGWGLMSTLVLPWIDTAKSYREVFDQAAVALAPNLAANGCVASDGFGESEAPMFAWYARRQAVPLETRGAEDCNVLIVQTPSAHRPSSLYWQPFWTGARPGDRQEKFILYRRIVESGAGIQTHTAAFVDSAAR